MNSKFIFLSDEKQNWNNLFSRLQEFLFACKNSKLNRSFKVEVERLDLRSSNQLKGYWVLINQLQLYFNEMGNLWDKETISHWVKIRSGHYIEINDAKVPRSISYKENCSKQDMKKIIDWIHAFAEDNHIVNCHLSNKQEQEVLDSYEY